MTSPFSPRIHLNDRTHHQHAGTGCSDPARKHGSDQKKTHIDPRGTSQISFQGDITRNTKKAEQQNDKGQLIIDNTL